MIRTGAIALVVGVASLLAFSGQALANPTAGPAIERDVVEVAAPEGLKISTVRIDNRLGNVTIHGHDSESIKIQSLKRANDASTLERLVVSLVPNAQGRVVVTTALRPGSEHKPVTAGSIAIDLIVYVPRHSAVDAEIWKGNLEVSKIDNGATLLVDNGQIRVTQVSGRVDSALRKGNQDFTEVFGDLRARAIEGDLRLRTIQGDTLLANVVRGAIKGEALKVSTMKVRSVFGDVDLMAEFVAGGSYAVSSKRGDVSLRFHGQTPVLVQVLAKSAMIGPGMNSASTKEGRWSARYGKSKTVRPAHLEVRSEAGSVLVKHF